eukprot:SAG31_NODE_10448_length_1137_cov_1.114644_1_plen_95_part_00
MFFYDTLWKFYTCSIGQRDLEIIRYISIYPHTSRSNHLLDRIIYNIWIHTYSTVDSFGLETSLTNDSHSIGRLADAEKSFSAPPVGEWQQIFIK